MLDIQTKHNSYHHLVKLELVTAMTAVPPDVKSLKQWEDAFQYPIPQVRELERQLQTELSSNKMKLRGLVGYVIS